MDLSLTSSAAFFFFFFFTLGVEYIVRKLWTSDEFFFVFVLPTIAMDNYTVYWFEMDLQYSDLEYVSAMAYMLHNNYTNI